MTAGRSRIAHAFSGRSQSHLFWIVTLDGWAIGSEFSWQLCKLGLFFIAPAPPPPAPGRKGELPVEPDCLRLTLGEVSAQTSAAATLFLFHVVLFLIFHGWFEVPEAEIPRCGRLAMVARVIVVPRLGHNSPYDFGCIPVIGLA